MAGKRADVRATPARPSLLVVDCDLAFKRAVSAALANHYHVTTARTGAAAWRKLRSTRPDVILLELTLPDSDGLLLMIGLKGQTNARIVVCTARDYEVDRALSRRLGAAAFIPKPVDFGELDTLLTEVVSGRSEVAPLTRVSKRSTP